MPTSADGADDSNHRRNLKDKVKHPFPELREKLKNTKLHDAKAKPSHLKHKLGKIENIANPNHRHDEAHEQACDAKRTAIAQSHRYQSFAPERAGNLVKW